MVAGGKKKTSLPFSRFSSLFSPSRHLVEKLLKGSSREDNEQVIARHLVVEITDSVRDPSCQGVWPRLLPHIHVCKTLMGSRPLAIQVCVVMWPEGHRWGGHAPDVESLSLCLSLCSPAPGGFTFSHLTFPPRGIVVESTPLSVCAMKSKHWRWLQDISKNMCVQTVGKEVIKITLKRNALVYKKSF